jgi:hypothetical protein
MVCQPEELKLWQTLYQAIKQDMRSQIFYQWIWSLCLNNEPV